MNPRHGAPWPERPSLKLGPMEEGTATTAVPQGLGPWAVELLGRLIQTNTVNPPGNERPVQEFLRGTLTAAGFECDLLEGEPGQPSHSSATSTPSAPTPTSGASIPGPAMSSTVGSAAGARST